MSKEKIIISDTNPEPWPEIPGSSRGYYGKRFYGQKDVPGQPEMCTTTLWTSSLHSPAKYLGTFKLEKKLRKHQDVYQIFKNRKSTITVQAERVDDDYALRTWVVAIYRWIPAVIILGTGIVALIATIILT